MAELMQGKNQYVYYMIERKLEYVGTGDGTTKDYTVAKTPIADKDLSGVVDTSDVAVYTSAANGRAGTLTSATVSTVDEKTGKITLSTAPTTSHKVYVTYHYVYGYVAYAQEYSFSESLDTKEITPLSTATAEEMEVIWKFEGSIKLWDDTDIEDELMRGIDQTADVTGANITMADENPIPVPIHNVVFKKVRTGQTTYIVLKNAKFSSLESSAKGGDLAEKDAKLTVQTIVRNYVPTANSGM